MHLSRIDLNLFVVFEAIYSEGSITRAAQVLHLTQPAVSHALARLRDSLQDELFVRSQRGMTPTPLAQQIIGPVRASLQGLRIAVQENREFDPQRLEKTFRLSLRDIFEVMLLPRLTREINRRAPRVEINCLRVARGDLQHELASGHLDLAADVLLSHDDNICHEKLKEDRLVCLLRRDHPLTGESLTLEAYLAARHVLVSSRERGPGYEDVELSRHGLRREIGLRTPHYYSAALVAAETDMILTVPALFAEVLCQSVPVVLREFPIPLPPMEVYLYWHRNMDRDPANRWLRELIFQVLA